MEDTLSLSWAGQVSSWYIRLPSLDREIANLYERFTEFCQKDTGEKTPFANASISLPSPAQPPNLLSGNIICAPVNSPPLLWFEKVLVLFMLGHASFPSLFLMQAEHQPISFCPNRCTYRRGIASTSFSLNMVFIFEIIMLLSHFLFPFSPFNHSPIRTALVLFQTRGLFYP